MHRLAPLNIASYLSSSIFNSIYVGRYRLHPGPCTLNCTRVAKDGQPTAEGIEAQKKMARRDTKMHPNWASGSCWDDNRHRMQSLRNHSSVSQSHWQRHLSPQNSRSSLNWSSSMSDDTEWRCPSQVTDAVETVCSVVRPRTGQINTSQRVTWWFQMENEGLRAGLGTNKGWR